MWNLKRNDTNELTYKKRLTNLENELTAAGGRDRGRVREFVMQMYTLLYIKWITNKDLLQSTGNSAQLHGRLDGRGVRGRMDTCICKAESLHCSPETLTTLLISYTPTQTKKVKKKKKKRYVIPRPRPPADDIF